MPEFTTASTAAEVATAFSSRIAGKVVLITGCSPNGLGAVAAQAIASHNPALLILAGRNRNLVEETEKALLQLVPQVKTRILIFDLASLKSVREAAEEVLKYEENIDVLINNAAIMATPFSKTEDGFESQLGVNHLGPFLFTLSILKKIPKGGRIVNVSSGAYVISGIRWEDPNYEEPESYNKWASYAQSKSANILFSQALAERLGSKGIYSYSLHVGGAIFTNLGKFLTPEDLASPLLAAIPIITHEQGASSYIAAAFDPELEASNGAYLEFCKPEPTAETATWTHGKENADKLWALSEQLIGQKFAV